MAFDPDAYLSSKPAAASPPAALARNEGPWRSGYSMPDAPKPFDPDEYLYAGQPDKPTKFVEPFHVPTEEEKFNAKPAYQKAIDHLLGRAPWQTQKGIDQQLAKGGIGPGTTGYKAIEGLDHLGNAAGGMLAGGAVGGAVTRGLLPHIGTGWGALGAKLGTGALSGAAGGAVGAGTETALGGGTPGEVAKSMAHGGSVGAVVGPPLALAGAGIARLARGAPARVAERELGGLKEGIQSSTRIKVVEPNEVDFRAALGTRPDIRQVIKADARAAESMVDDHVAAVAARKLDPVYDQLTAMGRDRVNADYVISRIEGVRNSFNPIAEKTQIAVANEVIKDLTEAAAANGGTLPVPLLRQTATAFQQQGFANLPMLGQVPLAKELKQGVGGAIRAGIGDHVQMAGGPELRAAYEAANREYATWARIAEVVTEKARRLRVNAVPMADYITGGVKQGLHYLKHPWEAAVDGAVALPGAVDRGVLAPIAQGAGRGATGATAGITGESLVQMRREQDRRQQEMAARLRTGGRQ